MSLSDLVKKRVYSTLSDSAYNKLLQHYHAVIRATRIVSSPLRALPDFLIVGAQKSGTTSLYRYLLSHPQMIGIYSRHPDGQTTWEKEVHYFDDNFDKPEWWYRFHFPLKRELTHRSAITGEGSPEYLYHPHVARRMASLVPEAKIIICLRNPVDRAISNYWHQRRRGAEDLTMREAFEKEEERIRRDKIKMKKDNNYFGENQKKFSYLDKGIYADQIERYFQYFERDQIMIIRSETLFEDTQSIFNKVLSFLDLDSYQLAITKSYNSGSYRKVDTDLRKELHDYFKPHNQRLYDLLNLESPWW